MAAGNGSGCFRGHARARSGVRAGVSAVRFGPLPEPQCRFTSTDAPSLWKQPLSPARATHARPQIPAEGRASHPCPRGQSSTVSAGVGRVRSRSLTARPPARPTQTPKLPGLREAGGAWLWPGGLPVSCVPPCILLWTPAGDLQARRGGNRAQASPHQAIRSLLVSPAGPRGRRRPWLCHRRGGEASKQSGDLGTRRSQCGRRGSDEAVFGLQ